MVIPSYRIQGTLVAESLVNELPSLIKAISVEYIKHQRWFGSKAKEITGIVLKDAALLQQESYLYIMTLVELGYENAESEVYYLPLALHKVGTTSEEVPDNLAVILRVESGSGTFLLYDALADDRFLKIQFRQIETSGSIKSTNGRFSFIRTQAFSNVTAGESEYHISSIRRSKAEQSNTSVIYNDLLIMKNFRRLCNGTNPDLEISLFLTTRAGFKSVPLVVGYIEYSGRDNFHTTIASLQRFIPNQGDGWIYTLRHLRKFYEFVRGQEQQPVSVRPTTVVERERATKQFSELYLSEVYHLGQITGGLHNALASDPASPDFAPELITDADVRTWISGIQSYGSEVLRTLESKSISYSPQVQEQVRRVASNKSFYLKKAADLAVLATERVCKIRYHNDYHLGQVLKTTDDFIIIDFEGEPARPIDERRAKHSALKDVAGMLRSFNYATYSALFDLEYTGNDRLTYLESWGKTWATLACAAFLDGYLDSTGGTSVTFLPNTIETMQKVLSVFQIDKAFYELNYELNNRPDWLEIPLRYIVSLLP